MFVIIVTTGDIPDDAPIAKTFYPFVLGLLTPSHIVVALVLIIVFVPMVFE